MSHAVSNVVLVRGRGWDMTAMKRKLAKTLGLRSDTLTPPQAQRATEANINLVLWRWGPDLPHKIDVFDPTGRLPRNQLSWPMPNRS